MKSLFYKSIKGIAPLFIFLFISSFIYAQCVEGNCKNGTGTMIYPDQSQYVGLFENGLRKQGIFKYKSGDVYEGGFTKNKREGYGKYIYNSGEEYNGYYSEDLKVFGIYKFKSGNEYTGQFENNKFHGFGILTKASGGKIEGEWVNGQPDWEIALDTVQVSNAQTDTSINFVNIELSKSIRPRMFAVVVGVSDYEGVASDLNYSDDDAKIFYNYLNKAFPNEIRNGEAKLLIDAQASYTNIVEELKRIFAKSNENDYIIFYFSGHGGRGSFAPYNLNSYSLSHSEVKQIFKSSKAKYRLCIADACYSGSVSSGQTYLSNYESTQNLRDARLAVFLSSSSNETSIESNGLRQGVFSYYLMRGLRGAADLNKDKYVTAGELFVYTRKAVIQYSGGKQIPVVIGQKLNIIPLCRLKK
jgi:hypothetical protein